MSNSKIMNFENFNQIPVNHRATVSDKFKQACWKSIIFVMNTYPVVICSIRLFVTSNHFWSHPITESNVHVY